jgi:lipoprotein-releasing system permease protein
MNLGNYIGKRLMRNNPVQSKGKGGGFSKLIINLALSAVAVSVMVMIIAVAIVKGYQQEVRQKIVGFHAPIQVTHLDLNNSFESYPILRDSLMERLVMQREGIHFMQRYAIKAGILKTEEAFEGVVLKGVDESYQWDFFTKNLIAGVVPNAADSNASKQLLISNETARTMQLELGSEVLIYFIQEPPRVRKMKVCGIFDTGLSDLDKLYAFTNIGLVQKLNQWDASQISGYEIGIKPNYNIEMMREEVVALTPYNMGLSTIFEIYPSLFDWLSLLDLNVVIILALMVAVASINMITALLILILERLQMVGIMKAMGATNQQISSIFLWMAGRIIGLGLLIGNLAGVGLALLQKQTGLFKLDAHSYYLNRIPIQLELQDLLWINLLAFGICLLILFLPVRLVARINPVKSIRFN